MSEVKVKILNYLSSEIEELMAREKELSKGVQSCQFEINEIQKNVMETQQERDSNIDYFSVSDNSIKQDNNVYLKKAEELGKKIEHYHKELGVIYEKIEQIKEIESYIQACEKEEIKESEYEQRMKLEILETQELERKRISMDLHDTVVQNLTTLIHKTELVTKVVDMDVVRAKLELQTMLSIIRSSINELRGVIYNLRPMIIDDLGFVATVQRFINQMKAENENMKIKFHIQGEERKLPPLVNTVLFRVIQEGCNNVKKYASAEKLDIMIIYRDNETGLVILDNGVGFDTEAYYNAKRDKSLKNAGQENVKNNLGITIMEERVQLLSGKFSIVSKINEGTKVEAWIPVKKRC